MPYVLYYNHATLKVPPSVSPIPCPPYRQVCGGPDRVRDACAANPACIAFSYQVSTKCGYLKAKAATSIMLAPQRDWVTYAGAAAWCA